MSYYVYVIQCSSTFKRYTGLSSDPEKRLREHNSGKSKFTSGYGPWRIIYTEFVGELADARKREMYLKTTAGKKAVKLMLGNTLRQFGHSSLAGMEILSESQEEQVSS